jgi:valacyclovir hydrolase
MYFAASYDEGEPRAIKQDTLQIDGRTINYEWCGSGRHILLLLPGALGSSRTDFHPQLKNLNRDIFTLYAWDPPGYGFSRPPDRDWPLHYLGRDADFAAQFMQALAVEKYSILGWSDGAITALMVAARNPENVRNMVIWGGNAYVDPIEMPLIEAVRDIKNWSKKMRHPFLEIYGEEYFTTKWNEWVDAYSRYLTDRDGYLQRRAEKHQMSNSDSSWAKGRPCSSAPS